MLCAMLALMLLTGCPVDPKPVDSGEVEWADATSWYHDADSDGYGDASTSMTACDQPSGWVPDSSDRDDTDATVNPDADGTCDRRGRCRTRAWCPVRWRTRWLARWTRSHVPLLEIRR